MSTPPKDKDDCDDAPAPSDADEMAERYFRVPGRQGL